LPHRLRGRPARCSGLAVGLCQPGGLLPARRWLPGAGGSPMLGGSNSVALAGFLAAGMLRHMCGRGAALWLGWPLCG
jgi:hypothetical protein